MTSKSKGSEKYVFMLHDIDINDINKRYCLYDKKATGLNTQEPTYETTNIQELDSNPPKMVLVDECKSKHDCHISIVDSNNCNKMLCCFWCRNKIDNSTISIGCPIQYIGDKAIKTYKSELSKNVYSIIQDIPNGERVLHLENTKTHRIDKYIVDGSFCSFNCCLSYIEDNTHLSIYTHSKMLLFQLFMSIFPDKNINIKPSPHWRLLKEYGGHLTLDKFRENIDTIQYVYHGHILPFTPIQHMYEETYNL